LIPGIWELLDFVLNTTLGLNIPVIWSSQNSSRIAKSYVMIDFTSNDVPDFDYIDSLVDYQGNRGVSSWRRATISLQFFCGPDSINIASQLATALAFDSSLDKQNELDVSIGTRLFLQRVPALLNESQWEDRAIYQFDFYYTERLTENVGFIVTVIVEGTYGQTSNSNSSELTETCTIEIPYVDPHGVNSNG
jgi:hypothetical protein